MKKVGKVISIFCSVFSLNAFATSYPLPSPQNALIGQLQYVTVMPGDTVVEIAHQHDVGQNGMEGANPNQDFTKTLHTNDTLKIPTHHLLPNQAREGIVVNLPEMRMYYYLPNSNQVLTYPIGIGKISKTIPIQNAVITDKREKPNWVPTKAIRDFNLDQGIVLPQVMPAGPDNPLGTYAVYMSIPTFLMHSTIYPESVGKRASFGCLRMYESDIANVYPSIKKGVPIVIVNSPIKVGWQGNQLYSEVHKPLKEHASEENGTMSGYVNQIMTMTKDKPTLVDWQAVYYSANERDGLPHEIGMQL